VDGWLINPTTNKVEELVEAKEEIQRKNEPNFSGRNQPKSLHFSSLMAQILNNQYSCSVKKVATFMSRLPLLVKAILTIWNGRRLNLSADDLIPVRRFGPYRIAESRDLRAFAKIALAIAIWASQWLHGREGSRPSSEYQVCLSVSLFYSCHTGSTCLCSWLELRDYCILLRLIERRDSRRAFCSVSQRVHSQKWNDAIWLRRDSYRYIIVQSYQTSYIIQTYSCFKNNYRQTCTCIVSRWFPKDWKKSAKKPSSR